MSKTKTQTQDEGTVEGTTEETTDPQSLLARIQALEARLDLVVRCNCLRESER